jgi:O-antigen chain-terminating bifunctional methyltransferase/kinase
MDGSAAVTTIPNLGELVAALPEIYQPIYGHPEFDGKASRPANDRLMQIMAVHEALKRCLGRPVCVLDLGCAQGWFCFHLANAGARVFGIDRLPANINVCNRLALENRGLNVHFKLAAVEQVQALFADKSFDLVLGLSVLHHICYHYGKGLTREIVRRLLKKIPSGIFELALAGEPVRWANSLPQDPAFLIDHAPFHRILSEHATHFSAVKRPLYFCSRLFWYFGDEAVEFQSWQQNDRGCRYFSGKDSVANVYNITGEFGKANRNAVHCASHFLKSPPLDYLSPPHLRQMGEAFDQAWLVHDKIEGQRLDGAINAQKPYDERVVLADVLRALAALEKARLYHGDLRTCNVLINGQGRAQLINFSQIKPIEPDCEPSLPFVTFFLFVRETVTRQPTADRQPLCSPFISHYKLPEPYGSWIAALFAKPVSQWSFAGLLESLDRLPARFEGRRMLLG